MFSFIIDVPVNIMKYLGQEKIACFHNLLREIWLVGMDYYLFYLLFILRKL